MNIDLCSIGAGPTVPAAYDDEGALTPAQHAANLSKGKKARSRKGKKKGGLSTPTAARQSTEPLEAPVRAVASAGRSAKMDLGEQHKFELGDCWET